MARYQKSSTPKLTKKLIEELVLILKSGAYIETAVAYCGISKDTFYRWLREAKSEGASELLKELSDAIALALAQAELRDLKVIENAAQGSPDLYASNLDGSLMLSMSGKPLLIERGRKGDWKASAWRLERRFPKKWGKHSQGAEDFDIIENGNNIKIEFV